MLIDTKALLSGNPYSIEYQKTGRPLINEPYIFPSAQYPASTKKTDPKVLMKAIKGTPECLGILKAITTDIFTKFTFRAIKNKKAGRPSEAIEREKEEKAMDFANKNFLKQELIACGYDWLGLGDGYLWKGKISETEIKELVKEYYNESPYQFNELFFKAERYV